MDDAAIRQLLERLARLSSSAVRYRQGEITDLDPLSVSLGGAAPAPATTLGSTILAVGDIVAVLAWGPDRLILDRLEPDPGEWQAPTFANGWTDYAAGDREVRYYRSTGRCHLEGIMKAGTFGSTAFTLLDGWRPQQEGGGIFFPVVGDSQLGIVQILNDGRVIPIASSNAWVDLSSISFRCR